MWTKLPRRAKVAPVYGDDLLIYTFKALFGAGKSYM